MVSSAKRRRRSRQQPQGDDYGAAAATERSATSNAYAGGAEEKEKVSASRGEKEDGAIDGVAAASSSGGKDEEDENAVLAESLSDLLSVLSKPEDMIHTLLLPGGARGGGGREGMDDEGIHWARRRLLSVSRVLFRRLEELARRQEELARQVKKYKKGEDPSAGNEEEDGEGLDPCPLSGLTELYTGGEEEEEDGGEGSEVLADAETIWGQVELQNEGLVRRLKMSVRKLAKRATGESHYGVDSLVRLVDLGSMSEDDEGEEEGSGNGPIGSDVARAEISSNEDNNGGEDDSRDEEQEDEAARRIRERMERAMADMDEEVDTADDSDSAGDGEEQASSSKGKAGNGSKEEDLYDPVAEEMKDGFFDLNDMEAFADEEEELLPDEAFGEAKGDDEELSKKRKLPHQQNRRAVDSSDSETSSSDGERDDFDSLEKKKDEPLVRRRKYRNDEDIEALYSLYEEPHSDDDEDDEDDTANMTAADFFGKPDKQYIERYKKQQNAIKLKLNTPVRKELGKHTSEDDNDSWDDHDFGEDGPDWRDPSSEEKKDGDQDGIDDKNEGKQNERDVTTADEASSSGNKLSSHAKYSKKLEDQTLQLEKEILAEKPWQMTGEAKGTARPTNSLLESTPEFEVATKMAPIITAEHTANIEEMIKRRVLNEDWDDVVPRELPDIGLDKRKGELPEVSQEKSKLGLGELYEREYLKKATGFDADEAERQTEEDKAKDEMKMLFANLCSKLDALCNYHFAPRPVADEAEVRPVTTPAIAMEEVLPLHVSDARGVAPEEVYGQKRGRDSVLKGESEMDQTERRRLRNAKKKARRKARKEKLADEKLISRLQPGLGLNNPYEKRKLREELSMARASGKVTAGELDANADYNTSTKFFKRMQDSVQDSIREGGEPTRKKKREGMLEEGQKSSVFKL